MITDQINDKPGRRDMQTTQQIFHNLTEIVELHPRIPFAQHLSCILRRKSIEGEQFHYWKNNELLKRIEQYKNELDGEELVNITEQE